MWKKFRIFVKQLLNNIIVTMVMPMNTNKNIIFLYTTNSARFVRETTAGHTKDMGE
jgi:hypothetical protein